MRYFIDTNIFLLLFNSRDKLDPDISFLLGDFYNEIIISSESVRELLMLIKKKKIDSKDMRSFNDVMKVLNENNIKIHYIDEKHLKKLSELQPAPDHYDPGDLIIISQAIVENIQLITTDIQFKFYKKQKLQPILNKS